MKITIAIYLMALVWLSAAEKRPATLADRAKGKPPAVTNTVTRSKVVYRPPRMGAPKITAGPATRGNDDSPSVPEVWAPDHVGLALDPQPILYWTQSGGGKRCPLEFALVAVNQPRPLLQLSLTNQGAGVQGVDLRAHQIRLQPGIEYRWSVSAVADPQQRSQDLVALGGIRLLDKPELLTERLQASTGLDRATVLAGEGIWYDALQTLVGRPGATRGGEELRVQARALLRQVGVTNLASLYP